VDGRPSESDSEVATMDKITPMLWFNGKAEEAARFYTSIFPNSEITSIQRSPADTPSGPEGMVLTVEYILDGVPFTALNGGPEFIFNESVSFVIDCADQAEVDFYWDKLVEGGGEHSVCGWLKDRYGLSWQVVPRQLNEMLESSDKAAARRAMEAMLQMRKLDVRELREAYEGVPA
jgi:predicted 3-demethylubiquinone-9 3-methyltransferase (glyoxalase superfamily)